MNRLPLCVAVVVACAGWAQGALLVNPGFEIQTTIPSGLGAATLGEWRGDPASIVTAQDGITPAEGLRMVQFVGTYPTGPIGVGSAIWQLVDVRRYKDSIVAGGVVMSVTAQFNRVAGDSQTDTAFGFFFNATASMPAQYPGYSQMETFLTDGDPHTWETFAGDMLLPQDTEFLLVGILALENVFDDSAEPFDGHYADNITLTLEGVPDVQAIPEPSSVIVWSIVGIGFACARCRRRRKPLR